MLVLPLRCESSLARLLPFASSGLFRARAISPFSHALPFSRGFSLSLFLGFGKRRTEVEQLGEESYVARPVMDSYSKPKLDSSLAISCSLSILSYLLFVTDAETISRHGSSGLVYTLPVVVYALIRYMFKVQEGDGMDPVDRRALCGGLRGQDSGRSLPVGADQRPHYPLSGQVARALAAGEGYGDLILYPPARDRDRRPGRGPNT